MQLTNSIYIILITSLLVSCSSKITYNPSKKLSVAEMQEDYSLMRNIYESEHPSLYWHNSKQYIDSCFDAGYAAIKDSLNEFGFRKIIAGTISNFQCGHTSVRASKGYDKWVSKANYSLIPLGMRTWKDTIAVSYNLYRKDTLIPKGSIIKSINGRTSQEILNQMFKYSSTDGACNNLKNIRISNNFPMNYLMAFDSTNKYVITYIDSTGAEKQMTMTHFKLPPSDTSKKVKQPNNPNKPPNVSKKQLKARKRLSIRNLTIDTANSTATLLLSSFSGGQQKKFYRKSFKTLNQLQIKNLILDVRNNGGGLISNADKLASYILTKPAKLADSAYTIRRHSKYNRYIKKRFWYGVANIFLTKKIDKNKYSFGLLTRRVVKPNKRHHYNGNVYAITGGFSFSATTVLLHYLANEPKVTTVGEATGGGAYGNSAIYIPDIVLPHSKLRLRLPLFRLVLHNTADKLGQPMQPDYYVPPNSDMIKFGKDNKIEKVKELIRNATN